MPSSTSVLSAETRRYAARSSVKLSDPGGLLLVVVRGTGTLVTEGRARIVGEGDAVALRAGELATFTAGPTSVELLEIELRGALDREAPSSPRLRHDSRIPRAIALMNGDLARRWTVAELSRKVGLSRSAFARLFKEKTGESPLRVLTRRRLSRAAELLIESDLGLAEIAERVGYESEFAFNRAFKRHHGVSPGAFRRRGGATGPVMTRAA
jgi:AraC-like DNA-binding protein